MKDLQSTLDLLNHTTRFLAKEKDTQLIKIVNDFKLQLVKIISKTLEKEVENYFLEDIKQLPKEYKKRASIDLVDCISDLGMLPIDTSSVKSYLYLFTDLEGRLKEAKYFKSKLEAEAHANLMYYEVIIVAQK
jgi:hypothetical protein